MHPISGGKQIRIMKVNIQFVMCDVSNPYFSSLMITLGLLIT